MTIGITELPPEGMQLGGVALAGDTERGTRTTEGLSLLFTTAGITVQGPQPQIERLLVWSGLDSATCHEKTVLPDGRNAAVMELTSGGQSIRFFLPTDTVSPGQAAYLDQALPAWLARYRGSEEGRAVAPSDVAGAGPASASAPSGVADEPGTQPGEQAAASHPGRGASGAAPAAVAAAAAAGAAAAGAAAGRPQPSSPAGTVNGSGDGTGSQTAATGSAAPGGRDSAPAAPSAPASSAPSAPASSAPSAPASSAPAAPASSAPVSSAPAAPPAPASSAPAAPSAPNTGSAPTPPPVPPPPPRPGARTWVLSNDPMAPGTEWDDPPIGESLAGEAPATKRRWGRRKAKPVVAAGAAAAAGATAAGMAASSGRPGTDVRPEAGTGQQAGAAETAGGTGDVAGPPATAEGAPVSDTAATAEAPATEAPATEAPATEATAGTEAAAGTERARDTALTPDQGAAGPPPPTAAEEEPGRRPRRIARLAVLGVLLLAAIGGIAYFAVSRNNSSSSSLSPSTSPAPTTPPDDALVAAVNLHLNDLPAGWTAPSASTPLLRMPVAGGTAEAQATQTLSSCLGVPVTTVAGLFVGGALPGQTASAVSPTFVDGTDPGLQMHSTTASLGTAAEAQAAVTPFEKVNFLACYTQFESTIVGASTPGATAGVQPVSLPQPGGVKTFGYITTVTSPQGTQLFGQSFMIGGRVVSDLVPATTGPEIPSSDFSSAYQAMTGRIAATAGK